MTVIHVTPKPYPPCTCTERNVGAVCLDCDGTVDDIALRAENARLRAELSDLRAVAEAAGAFVDDGRAQHAAACARHRRMELAYPFDTFPGTPMEPELNPHFRRIAAAVDSMRQAPIARTIAALQAIEARATKDGG